VKSQFVKVTRVRAENKISK